jgi:hypothetical protein
MAGDFA